MKIFIICIACLLHVSCFATSERKTVLITGASGELGSATARALAPDYNLILTGRKIEKLKQLKDELSSCEIFILDYRNHSTIHDFIDYMRKNRAPISGLVLVHPRPQFHGKAFLQEEAVWLEVFQNTFTGPLEVLKGIMPFLTNPSKIVVIAGTTSVQLQPEYGPSCLIQRMWTTYMKALSHELGPQGISINSISPGVVMTDFHQNRIQNKAVQNGTNYENQLEMEVANIPLRRHANPQEIANTIRFLISDQSDFINGVNLVIDGGFTTSY